MNYFYLASILVGTALALTPARAEACSFIECERLVDVELAQPGPIPAGETAVVLRPVLSEQSPRFNPEKSQEALVVTVRPTLGGPAVPGEVVAIAELGLLVWRPGAPLDAETEYEVAVSFDNAMLDFSDCGPDKVERTLTVTTGAAMVVPLVVPEVTTAVQVVSTPVLAPDTLVCCDGAHPVDQSGSCEDPVGWFEGTCSAGSSRGTLAVTATLDAAAVDAAMGQVGYHFFGLPFAPGTSEAAVGHHEPFCSQLTAIHLMTGKTMTGPEVCLGQDLKDELGIHDADPGPGLAMCAGEPYTCAAGTGPNGELWDSTDCSPWPEGQVTTDTDEAPTTGTDEAPTTGTDETPTTGDTTGDGGSSGETSVGGTGDGDGEKGCACASGEPGAPWALALLLALPRRRRPARG